MDKADGKCNTCKGDVPPGGSHGNLFYCSEPCRIEAGNANRDRLDELTVAVLPSSFWCTECNKIAKARCMFYHHVETHEDRAALLC